MVYFTYILHCIDLKHNDRKIGRCEFTKNRITTLATSYPRNQPELDYLIECKSKPDSIAIEDYLHAYYETYNTVNKHNGNGGIEWFAFDKLPSIEQLQEILKEFDIRIIHGDELRKYNEEIKYYIRKYNIRIRKERKTRIKKYNEEKIQSTLTDDNEFILFGYQAEVYEKIHEWINSDDKRTNIEVFCGGGKTVLYEQIFTDFHNIYDCFIFVLPSIPLIRDMKKRWLSKLKNHKPIFISSDCGATTNEHIIKNKCDKSSKAFIFITIHSFKKLEIIFKMKKYKNMFLIADEADELCDVKTTKKNSPLQWLKETNYEKHIDKMLFATASPKYGDYTSTKKNYVVMNNITYFGNKLELNYPANLKRLHREGFLCDYNIVMGSVKPECVRDIGDVGAKNKDKYLNYYAACILLKQMIISGYKPKKILMYTNQIGGDSKDGVGVRDLKKICNEEFKYFDLNNELRIGIFSADSLTSRSEREQAVDDFKSDKYDIAILINCRLFSRGVNIPNLDTVVFCDPKQSIAEIIQIFGRPLRNPDLPNLIKKYKTNKDALQNYRSDKKALIIIPYLDNIEYSDGLRYQKTLNIIKTISTQDPFLREELKHTGTNKLKRLKTIKLEKDTKCQYKLNFGVNTKIFNFLDSQLNIQINTLNDAILHVLKDNIIRMPKQIWSEIKTRNIWEINGKNSEATCSVICCKMFKKGEISRTLSSPYYYFIEKSHFMTTAEFIKSLKEKGISTENNYHTYYTGKYDKFYPTNPEKIYKDFSFKDLSCEKYYTLEQCIKVIKDLEPKILKVIGKKFKTNSKKNNLICKMDSMIPPDISCYYDIKLNKVNPVIFKKTRR